MSLVNELNNSQHRMVDCVRFAAAWLACIDHEYSESESKAILDRLPDREGGVSLRRMVVAIRDAGSNENYDSIAPVFAFIAKTLSEESRPAFVELMAAVAAADGRVSIGERHALMFLSDLVGRGTDLPRAFELATGLTWELPADLSDPNYWTDVERRSRDRSQQSHHSEQSGSRRESRDEREASRDPRRVEALAVLGLVGNPSQDDIKTAYRRMAKIHHPDRYSGLDAEAIVHATRTFQRIQQAFSTLKASSA